MSASDSHNPLPVSDDARVRELEAEVARLRVALKALVVDVEDFGSPRQHSQVLRVAREALEAGER